MNGKENKKRKVFKRRIKQFFISLLLTLILSSSSKLNPQPKDTDFFKFIKGDCKKCKILSKAEEDLKYLGMKIYKAKIFNEENSKSYRVSLNKFGDIVDDEDLFYQNKVAKFNKIGVMNESLWEYIKNLPDDATVSVIIWGKMYIDYPDKEELIAEPLKKILYETEFNSELNFAKEKVISALKTIPAKVTIILEDAPIIYAELVKKDLIKISKYPEIAVIFLDAGYGFPTSDAWYYTAGFNAVHQWGYKGNGEYVAIQNWYQPHDYTNLEIAETANQRGSTSEIATLQAGIIKTKYPGTPNTYWGAVPESTDYFANMDGYVGPPNTVEEWAISKGCNVFSYGWARYDASNSRLEGHDMYVDYLVKRSPYPFYVGSAGNMDRKTQTGWERCYGLNDPNYQYVQNKFYNGLIAGGSSDKGTISTIDDTIYECSSFKNPTTAHNDRELPEVVGPAECVDAGGVSCGNGTSNAASIVAGIGALIIDSNPALSAWPEIIRAIIIASGRVDINNVRLDLGDSVDDKDGAGEVNAAYAVKLSDPSYKIDGNNVPTLFGYDYGIMDFQNDFTPDNYYKEIYKVKVPPYNPLKIVLTWDSSATCPRKPNPNYDFCDNDEPDGDLDIHLIEGTSLKDTSSSWDNTYEYLYLKEEPIEKEYSIKIKKYSARTATTYFGIYILGFEGAGEGDFLCPVESACSESIKNSNEFQVSLEEYNGLYGFSKYYAEPDVKFLKTGEFVVTWLSDLIPSYLDPSYYPKFFRVLYNLFDTEGKKLWEKEDEITKNTNYELFFPNNLYGAWSRYGVLWEWEDFFNTPGEFDFNISLRAFNKFKEINSAEIIQDWGVNGKNKAPSIGSYVNYRKFLPYHGEETIIPIWLESSNYLQLIGTSYTYKATTDENDNTIYKFVRSYDCDLEEEFFIEGISGAHKVLSTSISIYNTNEDTIYINGQERPARRFVVVWAEEEDVSTINIYGKIMFLYDREPYNTDLKLCSSFFTTYRFNINASSGWNISPAVATFVRDKKFVVAWYNKNESGEKVLMRIFRYNGEAFSDEKKVNLTKPFPLSDFFKLKLDMITDDWDYFGIIFQAYEPPKGKDNIFYSKFDIYGNPVPSQQEILISDNNLDNFQPSISINCCKDRVAIVWTNGKYEIIKDGKKYEVYKVKGRLKEF